MPERRIIVGPCRSGTTMLLRSAKNHPDAAVVFQTIKAGLRANGVPDYGFFSKTVPDGKFLVNKETVGYGNAADCALQVFPDDDAIRQTRPVFIFREPRDTFVSWLENNLVPPDHDPALFIMAYRHVYEMLLHARDVSDQSTVVTYTSLCQEPERRIRSLCGAWDIAFHPNMVDWKDDFIDTTPLDKDGIQTGHYAMVSKEKGIRMTKKNVVLDVAVVREIDAALLSTYERILALCGQ